MIKTLRIQNYALIEQLEMSPASDLNIITGETGAGKSIMLGAIGLLLGNRADTKTLFSNDKKCIIEGLFDLSAYGLSGFFETHDLDYETECLIRREITPAGKSRGFINDTPVTLDVMKALGKYLMDIHSQHESLNLGKNEYQQHILDLFCEHPELLASYTETYRSFITAQRSFQTLQAQAEQNSSDVDYQQFLLKELDDAKLHTEEQDTLEDELSRLEHAEEIKTNLTGIDQLLDESEFSIGNQLTEALSLMSTIKNYAPQYSGLYERLNSAAIELKDLTGDIQREQDLIEYNPERIQEIKERLDLIYRLQQKHQVRSIAELLDIQATLGEKLQSISNTDEELSKAEKILKDRQKELEEIGAKLSKSRKQSAPKFATKIEDVIQNLGIENGKVTFEISRKMASSTGMDEVEMLFSANKGLPPQPIQKVASGGEFSRLIFAIKSLIAGKTALPTIIFDEIDTGISGQIALQMIGIMKEMSKKHQIISISHLPQFAAGGTSHYYVYKDHSSDTSVSKIKKLEHEERVQEIAKMIGGDQPGIHAVESAKEMLEK